MAPKPGAGIGWVPVLGLATALVGEGSGASSYSMWSIRWMAAGGSRRNLSNAPCSAGRSLPESVSVLPTPCTLAREPSPRSDMASSMRPLYSAAFAVRTDSGFLTGALSTWVDLTSTTGGVTGASASFGFASAEAESELFADESSPGVLAAGFGADAPSVTGGATTVLADAALFLCWSMSS